MLEFKKIFLWFLLFLTFFLSIYKLADSPPTWFDEGFIIQSAINLYDTGKMGIQIAPDEFVRDSHFFSTGYTVAYPVGVAFKIFGQGLFVARAIIVSYLMLFVLFFYLLAKEIWGAGTAFFSSLLLSSFAPLYGNGRNVLGEIPGMFFLILFLFFLLKFEKSGFKSNFYAAFSGLTFGFCVFTKSLFLVLIPSVFLTFIILQRNILLKFKQNLLFILFFFFPVVLFFKTQVSKSDSIFKILSIYSNPYAVHDIYSLVIKNITRFFTETTPIYFLILFIIFTASIIIKIREKKKLSITELISFVFIILVFSAYFRTAGWYRYLFTANVLLLFFLPSAVHIIFDFLKVSLFKNLKFKLLVFYKIIPQVFLFALIFIQFYQLLFNSWVSTHYGSERTKDLNGYFNKRDNSKSIFVYRSPEIVPFLHNKNYYQYLRITDDLIIGESELNKINLAVPDEIIINGDEMEKANEKINGIFLNYKEKDRVNKYLILERK